MNNVRKRNYLKSFSNCVEITAYSATFRTIPGGLCHCLLCDSLLFVLFCVTHIHSTNSSSIYQLIHILSHYIVYSKDMYWCIDMMTLSTLEWKVLWCCHHVQIKVSPSPLEHCFATWQTVFCTLELFVICCALELHWGIKNPLPFKHHLFS